MSGAPIEIRLLGPVEAVADGSPLPLGGRRQRALLALLALEPGRALPAGRLAEELWDGSPPAGSATTLRSYASRLRRVLGADRVAAEAGGYALRLGREAVDAHRFEELLREGREALARGSAGLACERLRAALGLWRGPALADVADAGALAAEARRLGELRLQCMEERIEAELALGRHDDLVAELRALVDAEPLRERLWRQLVLALYRCGRQADALAAYREARSLLDSELGLEPGEELRQLEREILRQEVAAVEPAEARHNLPAPATSFVGRERELAELERLLREHRLVTVSGLGGAGKTRLALETARRQAPTWADGVWLVDLTALADPGLVVPTVAATLALEEGSIDALLAHCRSRELLLVLDNCEHLVEACADLTAALLASSPGVRVLATSRLPLALPAECDYALEPLDDDVAVELFLERAGAVRRDLALDEQALATAAGICRELDGLPLAIELAAARAKSLSLGEIAERVVDRFRFLRAWQRIADPRHRTLQTMMDWSYDLLGGEEQALLRRLSVFAGGAELDAVAAVCTDGDDDRALELLGRLVDASLVRAGGGERTRYLLLETVRQYGASKLAEDPHAEAARRQHALHYLALAEAANLSIDSLGRGPQRQALVLREQHNLRAALDWAGGADVELGLRLMVSLENFWISHALAEGAGRYERLLAAAGDLDPVLRAQATRDHAGVLDVLGEFELAQPLYERSRELYRQAGDELGAAYLTFRIGIVASSFEERRDVARVLFEESLEVFRRFDDPIGTLQAIGCLGIVELDSGGDLELGRELIEQSVAMSREAGWSWWTARHLSALAQLDVEAGRAADAEPLARECLELAREMGNRQEILFSLALLARAAAARGEEGRALALWSAVEAVEDRPGRFGKFDRAAYAACMPDLPRPGPLPLDEAVALALGE